MAKDAMGELKHLDNYTSNIDYIKAAPPRIGKDAPSPKATTLVSNMIKRVGGSDYIAGIKMDIARALPETKVVEVHSHDDHPAAETIKMRNQFAREMSPTIMAAKQVMARLMPSIKYLVPDKLYSDAEKHLQGGQISSDRSTDKMTDDTRTDMISKSLSEIFIKHQEENRVRSFVDQAMENTRHRSNITELKGIKKELGFQSAFMRGTYTAYLKKSLELKYRHLFVAKDTLASVNLMSRLLEVKLEEIKHNTGLSEYAKMTTWKLIKQSYRKQLSAKVESYTDGMIERLSDMAVGSLSNKASNLARRGNAIIGGKSDETGLLKKLLSTKLGRDIWEANKGELSSGHLSSGSFRNISRNTLATIQAKLAGGGSLSKLLSAFLPENMNPSGSSKIANKLGKGSDAAIFDMATRMSIVEVIPGYLSKISKYVADMATKSNTEELVYNSVTRDFEGVSTFRKSFIDKTAGAARDNSPDIRSALSGMKSAFGKNVNPKMKQLDKMLPEYAKVIANLAYNGLLLEPAFFKAYAGGSKLSSDIKAYIAKAFRGISDIERKKNLSQIIALIFYPDDRTLDSHALAKVNSSILSQSQETLFNKFIPGEITAHGYGRHFRDMMTGDGRLHSDHVIDRQTNFDEGYLASGTDIDIKNDKYRNKVVSDAKSRFSRFSAWMSSLFSNSKKGMASETLARATEALEGIQFGTIPMAKWKKSMAGKMPDMGGLADLVHGTLASAGKQVSKANLGSVVDMASDASTSGISGLKSLAEKGRTASGKVAASVSEMVEVSRDHLKVVADEIKERKKSQTTTAASGDTKSKSQFIGRKCYAKALYDSFEDYKEYRKVSDSLMFAQTKDIGAILQHAHPYNGPLTVRDLLKKTGSKLSSGAKSIVDMYTHIYGSAINSLGNVATAGLNLGSTIGGKLLDKVKFNGGISRAIASYFGMYGSMARGAGTAIQSFFMHGKYDPYTDIYAKDRVKPGDPLLTRVKQEEGVTFADGKPLKRSSDINRPVFDPTTKQCLITANQIKHGLVDVNNKALGSASIYGPSMFAKSLTNITDISRNIIKFVTGAGGSTLDFYYKMLGHGMDIAKGGIKGSGKMLMRMLGFDTGVVRNLGEVTSRMDVMTHLLRKVVSQLGGDPSIPKDFINNVKASSKPTSDKPETEAADAKKSKQATKSVAERSLTDRIGSFGRRAGSAMGDGYARIKGMFDSNGKVVFDSERPKSSKFGFGNKNYVYATGPGRPGHKSANQRLSSKEREDIEQEIASLTHMYVNTSDIHTKAELKAEIDALNSQLTSPGSGRHQKSRVTGYTKAKPSYSHVRPEVKDMVEKRVTTEAQRAYFSKLSRKEQQAYLNKYGLTREDITDPDKFEGASKSTAMTGKLGAMWKWLSHDSRDNKDFYKVFSPAPKRHSKDAQSRAVAKAMGLPQQPDNIRNDIKVLEDMIKREKDPRAKAALQKELAYTKNVRTLNKDHRQAKWETEKEAPPWYTAPWAQMSGASAMTALATAYGRQGMKGVYALTKNYWKPTIDATVNTGKGAWWAAKKSWDGVKWGQDMLNKGPGAIRTAADYVANMNATNTKSWIGDKVAKVAKPIAERAAPWLQKGAIASKWIPGVSNAWKYTQNIPGLSRLTKLAFTPRFNRLLSIPLTAYGMYKGATMGEEDRNAYANDQEETFKSSWGITKEIAGDILNPVSTGRKAALLFTESMRALTDIRNQKIKDANIQAAQLRLDNSRMNRLRKMKVSSVELESFSRAKDARERDIAYNKIIANTDHSKLDNTMNSERANKINIQSSAKSNEDKVKHEAARKVIEDKYGKDWWRGDHGMKRKENETDADYKARLETRKKFELDKLDTTYNQSKIPKSTSSTAVAPVTQTAVKDSSPVYSEPTKIPITDELVLKSMSDTDRARLAQMDAETKKEYLAGKKAALEALSPSRLSSLLKERDQSSKQSVVFKSDYVTKGKGTTSTEVAKSTIPNQPDMSKLQSALGGTSDTITKVGEKQVNATQAVASGIDGLRDLLSQLVKNTNPLANIHKSLTDNLEELGKQEGGTSVIMPSSGAAQSSSPVIGASKLSPAYL